MPPPLSVHNYDFVMKFQDELRKLTAEDRLAVVQKYLDQLRRRLDTIAGDADAVAVALEMHSNGRSDDISQELKAKFKDVASTYEHIFGPFSDDDEGSEECDEEEAQEEQRAGESIKK